MQESALLGFEGSLDDEILRTVETPIVVLDRNGAVVRFNAASERLTGYSAAGALGRKIWEFLIVDEEIEAVRAVFEETCGASTPTHFINYWKTKTNERRLIEWSNKRLNDKKGDVAYILATGIDITESRSREKALSESKAFLRSIIDASPVAVITISEQGRILTFSHEAERTFGYKEAEVLDANVSILMPEPDRSMHDNYIRHHLETGESRVIGKARQVEGLRRNGETFPARIHITEFTDGSQIFVGFVEDLTNQAATERRLKETQSQLLHAGRVGELGEMATSIAHELNQPLTASSSLAGAVALMLRKVEFSGRDDAIELLQDAVGEIRRASEIIRQMRDFVRKRKTAKSLHDVNQIIEEACAIAVIGAEGEGIKVKTVFDESLGAAELDRTQIQQVVTNLIRNAIDAMRMSTKKELTISTGRHGELIEVKVADTGSGIPPELKNRLFDSFVTSKDDGLGVGLSISKTIIEAHHGELTMRDNKPAGTVFQFRLPPGGPRRPGITIIIAQCSLWMMMSRCNAASQRY